MTTEITARDKLLLYVVGMLAFIFFFVQFMLTPALEASDEAAASLAEAQQAQIAMQETIALAGTNALTEDTIAARDSYNDLGMIRELGRFAAGQRQLLRSAFQQRPGHPRFQFRAGA